nr:AAA family ATPase [Pseudomonas sp. NW5]
MASAGLFAITGATGAGKSTLLDALCLALFGETPRLKLAGNQARIPDAAGDQETLTSNDGRNLLRRGCSSGYAEVDFLGVDQRRYRARWEVRRARERATGRLQASQQSLQDLETGQLLCSAKLDFQQRIEVLLGLNHAQFTRAVLLAQSEFSAFLKASDNERGELLEKLTDSQLYSQLGQAAFLRARDAREVLQRLEQQLGERAPLEEADRQELEQQHRLLAQTLSDLRQQQETLTQQRQWRLTLAQLEAAEQQASDTLAQRMAAHAAAAAQRQQLALLEQLAPVRHAFLRLAELPEQQAGLEQRLAQYQQQAHRLQQQVEQQAQLTQQALQRWQTAQQARQHAAAPLARAWQLEQQREVLDAALTRSHSQAMAAQQALAHSEEHLHAQAAAQTQARGQLKQLDAHLQRHAALQPLCEAWEGQIIHLRQALQLANRMRQGEREQPLLDAACAEAHQRHQQLHAEWQALLAPLQGISPAEALTALQAPLRTWRQQLEQLEHVLSQLQHYQQLQAQQASDRQQHAQLIAQEAHCKAEGLALRQALDEDERQLAVQQALLERQRLLRSASVEALRNQLQPGEPCAVCGSLEHPYHQDDALLAAIAEADLTALKPLREQIAEQQMKRGERVRELLELRERRAALDAQQERLETERRLLQQALQAQGIAPHADRAALLATQQQLREAIDSAEQEQSTLLTLQQQSQHLQQACHLTEQQWRDSQALVQHQQQQLTQDRRQLAEAEQAFTRLMPEDWLARWRQDPAATLLALEPQVQEQREARQQRESLQGLLGELQTRIAQLQLQRDHAEQILLTLQQQQAEQREQAAHNRQQLAECLGEFPSAAAWQQYLEQQDAQQHQEAQAQQQRLHSVQQQLIRLDSEQRNLQQRLDELRDEQRQLAAALADWRQRQVALDDDQLLTLLAVDPAQLEPLRQQLQQEERQLAEARTRLQERQQQRAAHRNQMPAPAALEQLEAALQHTRVQLEQYDQELTTCRARLLDDDQRRAACAHLQERIQSVRQEHQRWARISDLIGSADGAAFRRIAQASNLDLLVRHANVQLTQLSRRYRLQRGGSPLGLLICDTEMGDELRSVHSLSGGETFLVSLALALGLAAMASSTLRIESLFIDEGFGSLDPESLQLAMDALDGLQAQGRKVGVISHVQEMHERISVQIRVRRLGNGASRLEVKG